MKRLLSSAYAGRRVLLTGHTGFKGSWFTLMLRELGAEIHGYALAPSTDPSLFGAADIAHVCEHNLGDVRDPAKLSAVVARVQPDFVFHLAAQPLVRASYRDPLDTFHTNVIGTAALLDAVRLASRPCAVVIVTSDKCYENREWVHGYREDDALGGHDPYSASKGAAEIVTASYRRSFFAPERFGEHGIAIASARAGNVIGGGDWSEDRIVVDAIRALAAGRAIPVRNPHAVRPWQHVLEPLTGYLALGAQLRGADAARFCESWNLGPLPGDTVPVAQLVSLLIDEWSSGSYVDLSDGKAPHEASLLRLAIDKAIHRLGWTPRWSVREAVRRTVEWYRAFYEGMRGEALRSVCARQFAAYLSAESTT